MKLRLLALCSVATCALVVACSGDDTESTPAAASDAGANVPTTPQPEVPNAPADSGSSTSNEEDGGIITEGGGDPDEEADAGLVADAGADGGTCGPASGNGAAVASSCSSSLLINGGGTITPGTYDLVNFIVTGNATYCSTYKPSSYSGRLDIASDGQGGFILGERAVRLGGLAPLMPNKSFTATAGGNTLNVAQTCGLGIKATSFGYSTGMKDGKPTLLYTHDSGSATVRYRWMMR